MSATTTASRLLTLFLVFSFISIPLVPITETQLVNDSIPAADEPLSIILMIGDGMGFEHVEFARLVEVGESGSLNMQVSDWNASVATYPAGAVVTDSSAAATAMATGSKTNNGFVAMNPSHIPLETILEYAKTQNKSTGVVATSRITHATPASFMTHVIDRNDETEIARQIVEEADVDLLLGGGLNYFTGTQISTMTSNGYSVVYNRTELAEVTSGRIFGLFSADHMDYEYDRDYSEQPSIAEMTNKSLEILSQDADGFFLMVEGSRIDHAAHAWDEVRNALDTIAFDKAVDVAIDYVENNNNTILIVTADHETGGLAVMSHNLNTELPADLPLEENKRTLRAERVSNVTVDWSTTSHTSSQVPLFAFGEAFSDLDQDIAIDNTEIYNLMKDFYLGNPLNATEIPTTSEPTDTVTGTNSTTGPTSIPGAPIDSTLILAASIGAAVIILITVFVIRRR